MIDLLARAIKPQVPSSAPPALWRENRLPAMSVMAVSVARLDAYASVSPDAWAVVSYRPCSFDHPWPRHWFRFPCRGAGVLDGIHSITRCRTIGTAVMLAADVLAASAETPDCLPDCGGADLAGGGLNGCRLELR